MPLSLGAVPLGASPLALTPIAAAFGWVAVLGAAAWASISLLEQVNLLLYGRADGEDGGGADFLEIGLLIALLIVLFRR